MKLAITFLREARREFDDAHDWYESRRTGCGDEFSDRVDEALNLILQSPESWPFVYKDLRCVIVKKFPYAIFYRLETHRIVVVAVFHGSRNPIHWQRRVR